jgi:hypothetical protein
MKLWEENKIKELINNNDRFIINILVKLNEFDLLKYNEFLKGVYDFRKTRGFLTKKQINGLRNIFKYLPDVITKMANGEKIYFGDIYTVERHDPIERLHGLVGQMFNSDEWNNNDDEMWNHMNQFDFIG